jgi:hypothetical protein
MAKARAIQREAGRVEPRAVILAAVGECVGGRDVEEQLPLHGPVGRDSCRHTPAAARTG